VVAGPPTINDPNAPGVQSVTAASASLLFDGSSSPRAPQLAAPGQTTFIIDVDAAGKPTGFGKIIFGDLTIPAVPVSSQALPDGARGVLLGASTLGLQFSEFGVWAAPSGGPNGNNLGVIAGGMETPAASMPKVGTATYTGGTVGVAVAGPTTFALAGDATIVADFSRLTAQTSFTNMQAQNIQTGATAPWNNLSGTSTISGSRFSGGLASSGPSAISPAGVSGSLAGQFNGPGAQETTGAWAVAGGNTSAVGSFAAKRP
jgi:hypothetical protein